MCGGATYTIGLIQMACAPDPAANLETACARVREAASRGAGLICLPELFRSRYFCQVEDASRFDLAETIPGPTTEAMSDLARETEAVLVVPVFERRAPGVYHNSVVVIDPDGRTVGRYRKMHVPDDPGYYEKFYFAPGDLGFGVWPTARGRVGTLICWDQWFPEAARAEALGGAELIVYPTAIGWHPAEKEREGLRQLDAWRAVQRGHAVANGLFLAAVNRVGLERDPAGGDGIEFWGGSFVYGPQGEVLAEAPIGEEAIVLAPIERERVESVRRSWPFLRDRRIDAYGGLTRRLTDG